MTSSKSVFVLSAFVVCFAFVHSALDDYPSADLPGLAVPHDDYAQEIDANVKVAAPCCFPDQWEGNVTGQATFSGGRGGRSKFGQSSSMVFVDKTNGRIAGRGPAGRYHNETGGFIVLFKANKTADLYLFKIGAPKCWHKTLNKAEFRPQCIPANATLKGEFNLGPKDSGLKVQSWGFCGKSSDRRGSTFVGGKIVIVETNCIPVLIQDHGFFGSRPRPGFETNEIHFEQEEDSSEDSDELDRRPGRRGRGRSFSASSFFSNIDPKINDPQVFTPPSYCNATITNTDEQILFDGQEMPAILERFISY